MSAWSVGRVLATALALSAIGPHQAHAQSASAAGFGLTTCTDAGALFDRPAYRQAFLNWTMGYLTGANGMAIAREQHYRELSSLNADLVMEALRTFCADNPSAQVVKGVEVLWLSLPSRSYTEKP